MSAPDLDRSPAMSSATTSRAAHWAEDLLLALPAPIAVVGNATPRWAWGRIIDRYASVIRLNNYRLAGFEDLVGARTDLRATSAWYDIEHRDAGLPEICPFAAAAREAEHLPAFNLANHQPVLPARRDVRPLIGETPNPSTGLTLVQLLESIGVSADLFGFDGFQTPHYWSADAHETSHSSGERAALLARPGVAIYIETVPYADVFAADGQRLRAVALAHRADPTFARRMRSAGGRVLEVCAVESVVAELVSPDRLTTVVVADAPTADRPGGVLALAWLDAGFDTIVCPAVLDELHPNDARVLLRQAARLASRIVLTVRDADVWMARCAADYDVECIARGPEGFVIVEGVRRTALRPGRFAIRADYTARATPAYFADLDDGVVWQPDVYRLVGDLAAAMGCRRVIDLGCGRARKLAALHPAFAVVGVDMGDNLTYCREHMPFGDWIDADFEAPSGAGARLRACAETAIVSSDVIEHLVDPSGLMATVRELLQEAPFAILTTPERDLTHGVDHDGPPPNPSHVREWNLAELTHYARTCGLDVAWSGLTASHSVSFEPQTSLLLLAGRGLSPGQRDRVVALCIEQLDAYARERADAPAPTR